MSIHCTSWVLKNSSSTLGARLVLIALASYAGEDGTGAWPSVKTIAHDANLSRKATQAALRRLEADGLIRKNGTSPYGTTIYEVLMVPAASRTGGEETTPPGEAGDPGGRTSTPRGGEADGPEQVAIDALTVPEPSSEPSNGNGVSDEVGDLFAYWNGKLAEGRAQLTDGRRSKLKARLAEPPTKGPTRADDIRAAIDFVASSDWHRERGHIDLVLICRSPEQLDGYLNRSSAKASGPDLSIYDQAVQN
jgi:hypothetical protein